MTIRSIHVAGIFVCFLCVACALEKSQSPAWPIDIDTPQLFLPGIVTSHMAERDLAFSPDGTEIFYTLASPKSRFSAIVHTRRTRDGWTKPAVASFSGKHRDLEPAFAPTGQRLYFASNRPVREDDEKKDYDIWYADKTEDGWGRAQHLEGPINTDADEYYPSVAANGNLYFTASYADAKGLEDIYVSRLEDGVYTTPVSLDSSINTASYEFNAFVAPDESYLIFSSFGRADGLGGGDLYLSQRDESGRWHRAIHLPAPFNSTNLDYCPAVWNDSLFFFSSDRHRFNDPRTGPLSLDSMRQFLNSPKNGAGDIYVCAFHALTDR